jgi:putative transposase
VATRNTPYPRGMARPLRLCLPDGLYHVIARGNARQPIVADDHDRNSFFHVFAHVLERFGWLCHAFCVMDNHYHLVVETPLPNLPSGMRQLNGLYAQRFNRRHGRIGHLFQARYRSILIEKPTRLLAVCRYVVLNPVRAGICRDPGDWPWSSYRQTAGLPSTVKLADAEPLLARLGVPADQARAHYRFFVAEGLAAALVPQGERLGEESFLRQDFGLKRPPREVPRVQWLPLPPTLPELFAAGDETPVATAYRRYGYTLRQIGEYLGCHYSTASRRLRREEAQVLHRKT